MSKRPLATAAEGLPSLTRRLFLRGAAVAAPLVAVPALAAAAKHYAEENPALLALEVELDAAEAEMIAASAAYNEAFRAGSKLWPKAPETITYKRGYAGCGDLERNIAGGSWEGAPGVQHTKYLEWDVIRSKRWKKMTPAREEMRERALFLYAEAEAYEKACAHAKEASGFPAAAERRRAAMEALEACLERVHTEKAETMAGVLIKAKAFRAWKNAPLINQMFNAKGPAWTTSFAASVLEIMEG